MPMLNTQPTLLPGCLTGLSSHQKDDLICLSHHPRNTGVRRSDMTAAQLPSIRNAALDRNAALELECCPRSGVLTSIRSAALGMECCPRYGVLPSSRSAALEPECCPRSGTLPSIQNAALDPERCPQSRMLPSIRNAALNPERCPSPWRSTDCALDAPSARHGRPRCSACLSCWPRGGAVCNSFTITQKPPPVSCLWAGRRPGGKLSFHDDNSHNLLVPVCSPC